MLTLKQRNDEILIKCAYSYRLRVKKIPGAYFDLNAKAWAAPISSLHYIKEEFDSEIYYQTPLWKLEGKDEPPQQDLKFFDEPCKVPDMNITPYSYQKTGIQFCVDRLENIGFCMVGDSVGLGKTVEATGVIKWYKDNKRVRRILIICKKSIKTQWASEIKRFTGWDKIFVTGDTPKKRIAAYEGVREGGVLITNYHNFLNDAELIQSHDYDLCIVDEAHCIKGRDSKMNKLIGDTIKDRKTVLLTGTPVMSKPDDIWGIVHMPSPKFFGSYSEFEKRFLVVEYGIYGRQIVGAKNLNELQNMINTFLIRRTAEDVHLDLPETLPPIKIITSADSTQKKLFAVIEKERESLDAEKQSILDSKGYTDITKIAVDDLNEKGKMYLAALQFAADDPNCFNIGNSKSKIKEKFKKMVPKSYKMSEKTEATLDIISEILAEDEKVLVFCHYASSTKLLKEAIENVLGETAVLYTGGENDEARDRNIERFRSDVNIMIGTEACAEGLNLQFARYLINYEQADTYAQREQRIGRIRRIGSKYSSITVYDMVTEGSFDEVKLNKLMRDKNISEALIG